MCPCCKVFLRVGALLALLLPGLWVSAPAIQKEVDVASYYWQLPNEQWKTPFAEERPVLFVNRGRNPSEWDKLPQFWNEVTLKDFDPRLGQFVERKGVKIKVPLGLTQDPPVPAENPMTVAKWKLGKQLYHDRILSSDRTVSCASCHDPARGFTDQAPVSTGINGLKGGMSAPTVYNSAFNALHFWDGRASSLEDQSQGPPQNPIEMFDGKGDPWVKVVQRVRSVPDYVKQFRAVFGTEPTRDAVAKAIATYERTVLSGNSIQDRADLAMRLRVEEEGLAKFEIEAKDYAKVLKEAFAKKDGNALTALRLDLAKDQGKIEETAKAINNGRVLFFGKARCNACHVGDNYTDNQFHNLGVGVKDGKLPPGSMGRFASMPIGNKNAEMVHAFKTPTLRHLGGTAPYMHDGSEKSLEDTIELYNRGGNVNEFLDPKMRDFEAEKAWLLARKSGKPHTGPQVHEFNGKPVVPLKLNLTRDEVKDLTLFLRALQGDTADPIVVDVTKMPK